MFSPRPRRARASLRSPRMPPSAGVTQGADRRRDHRVPARQRPARLLFPDAARRAHSVNVTYLVGSRHETTARPGMAHLLEHLVFKGTPDLAATSWDEMSRRGMRINGTTWFDRTNYFETFNASHATSNGRSRWKPTAWSTRASTAEDLDTEMTVVRNEMERGENNPSAHRCSSGCSPRRIAGTTTASRTIGARSDVEDVDIDRLRAFYRTYYQPDNAVVVVAGEFDAEQTLALDREVLRRRSPSPRARCRGCIRRSRCRTASASSRSPRRRPAAPRRGVSHAAGRASRCRGRRRARRRDDRSRLPAACTRRWWKRSKATQRQQLRASAPRSRLRHVLRAGADGRFDRRRARDRDRDARRRRQASRSPRPRWIAPARARSRRIDDVLSDPHAFGVRLSEVDRGRRLAPVLRRARPVARRDRRRRAARRARNI